MLGSDPVQGFMFILQVDGVTFGNFLTASGFESSIEVTPHKSVNSRGIEVLQQIPGRQIWSNIVLGLGLTKDKAMWNWHKLVIDGQIDVARKDGSVIMFDHNQNEVVRYNFRKAWPIRWKGADVSADDNGAAVEEIEIVHEGIERVGG